MKNSILLLAFLFSSTLLLALEYKVNFSLNDGSTKSYKLAEINNINILAKNSNYMMKIFYQGSLTDNFPTKNIDSIKFQVTQSSSVLLIKLIDELKSYNVTDIDSINFFIPDKPIPQITSINPTSGKVGDEIKVTGTNFGATQGTCSLSFKNKGAVIYSSWTDTEIKVKVPPGTESGPISVTVGGVKSNELEFTLIHFITTISPISGRYGDVVTIKGMSFGSAQKQNIVVFNGINAKDYTSWNDTLIKVKVPNEVKTGKLSVVVDGVKSNEILFTILHSLASINPTSARIGDTVSISGISFGAKKDSSFVSFNLLNVKDYISWSDTLVNVKVPVGTFTGTVSLTMNKSKSNVVNFSVIPRITQLSPDSAGISQNISIFGNGFGKPQGSGIVSFNGADAKEYLIWDDTELRVTVPEGAKTGKVTVTASGNISNELQFTLKPYIVSINPTAAKLGTEVTITGYNFGATQGSSFVSFYKANGSSFVSWSDTEIKLLIPTTANSGKVSVTVGNVRSNEVFLSIIPEITTINPNTEKIAGQVTITGLGFNDARGTSIVSFAGADVSDYMSWSSTSIIVKVPSGSRTGKVSVTSGTQKSNEVDFTLLPSISGIQPGNGLVGDMIIISGASFGSTQGTSYVSFNGTNVTNYQSWSESEIRVLVPAGATSGKVYVMVGALKSNEVDFIMTPQISSITPDRSNLGGQITITGVNFGATRGSSVVSFNAVSATSYQSWSNNSIVVTIPNSAVSGKVSVTVSSIKSNEVDFLVTSVIIGNQEWMSRNLDVSTYRNGDAIPECTDNSQWDNLTTGAWCYYSNNSDNGVIYGKLYNWFAVNDSRGLAPSGWHIPTDAEFTTLTTYLNGESVAGGKMKETGTAHWTSPNTNATNESSFTALGAGYRYNGYNRLGDVGAFWSSTSNDASTAWERQLVYSSGTASRVANIKTIGFSVRCIKD